MVSEKLLTQALSRAQMMRWLKKHAMRLPAGPLTALQERDIAECFKLLDEDGSGALDISELVKAFKMLGFKADRTSVKAMMRQVQGENREELQQHEFRALMAHSLTQESSSGPAQPSDASPMSFQEIARATKRAKDLEAICAGGQRRQDFIENTSSPATTARSTRRRSPVKAQGKSGPEKLRSATDGKACKGQAEQISNSQSRCYTEMMSEVHAQAHAEQLILSYINVPWLILEELSNNELL